MTSTNKPKENTGNETTTSNPKGPGQVERVNPVTGGDAGTIDSGDTKR